MHPLQTAAAALHHVAKDLHESLENFEFTEREQDHVIDLLIGAIPTVLATAQQLFNAALQFVTNR